MARVYLAVPIIANRDMDKARFIASIIEGTGHDLVSKWVISDDPGFSILPHEVFDRDIKGIKVCDILVAEISERSHGVGMELMQAYIEGKKILCLFRDGTVVSRMIRGLPNILLIEYISMEELEKGLKELLKDT